MTVYVLVSGSGQVESMLRESTGLQTKRQTFRGLPPVKQPLYNVMARIPAGPAAVDPAGNALHLPCVSTEFLL